MRLSPRPPTPEIYNTKRDRLTTTLSVKRMLAATVTWNRTYAGNAICMVELISRAALKPTQLMDIQRNQISLEKEPQLILGKEWFQKYPLDPSMRALCTENWDAIGPRDHAIVSVRQTSGSIKTANRQTIHHAVKHVMKELGLPSVTATDIRNQRILHWIDEHNGDRNVVGLLARIDPVNVGQIDRQYNGYRNNYTEASKNRAAQHGEKIKQERTDHLTRRF